MRRRDTNPFKPAALSPSQRVGAGLTGVAGIVLGIVALFRGRDGAADVALLTLGSVFTLVALVDLVPTRVRLLGAEIDFLASFLQKLAAEHPDAIEPTAATLADTAEEMGRPDLAVLALGTLKAVGAVRAAGYQGRVASAIRRALPKGASFVDNMTTISAQLLSDPRPQIILRNNSHVGLVHIYEQQELPPMKSDVSAAMHRQNEDALNQARRLWITEDEPKPVAKDLLERSAMTHVLWRTSSDDEALRRALAEILGP